MTMSQLLVYDNWSGVVGPIQEKIPYSNLFFIIYIVVMKFALLNLFMGLIINSMQIAARRENKRAMEMLTSNIEAATELETKIEATLENKVDDLMAEIKSLRILLNKSP
jgi:voltage-gated sodium channel